MYRQRKAVTLIELVVVIVITGIVAVALSGYIRQAIDVWDFVSYRSEVVNDVRMGMLRMGRDIRQLQEIVSANDSMFCFSAASGNYLRYRYDNRTIWYEESNAVNGTYTSNPFIDNISDMDFFDYFDANMNAAANNSDIKYIRLKPRLNYRGETLALDYDIAPRGLQ